MAKNAKVFSPYCDILRLKIHVSGNESRHWMVRATGNQQRHLAASLQSLLFHVSNRQLAETPSGQFAKVAAFHVSNRQLAETLSGQFAKPAAFHVSNRQLAETPSGEFAKPAAFHGSNRQLAETPSGQFAKPAPFHVSNRQLASQGPQILSGTVHCGAGRRDYAP